MSRTVVVAGLAVVGLMLLASLSYGTATPAATVGTAACSGGSVSAKIGSRHRCLRAGQQCKPRFNKQFHRYGFHCFNGRLQHWVLLPSAGKVVATIRLHSGPIGAVSSGGAVWVAEHEAGTVARIDPATNTVVARVDIPSGQPARLAAGPEGLWHLPYSDNTLQELDPAANTVSTNISSIGEPGENCCLLAVGAGSVWVPKAHDGVYRVDAHTHAVVAHVAIPNFDGSAFGYGSLWGASGGDVFRLDPATNSISARIPVPGLAKVAIEPGCCPAYGVGLGAVWVAAGAKVARIDPATNGIAKLIRTPGRIDFLATTDDAVWAVGQSSTLMTTLWRIDPASNKVVASLPLARNDAADLVAGSGSLWVTFFRDDKLLRIQPKR